MNRSRKLPYATIVIIILCVLDYAIEYMLGMDNTAEAEIVMGAYYKPLILAGEWWRFLTVGFVHGSIFHLAMNMISLYSLGSILEPMLGRVKYLLVLFFSTLGSTAFLFACSGNTVVVGISGGLYGLMACFFIQLWLNNQMQNPAVRSMVVRICIINLLINFYPGVSYIGHLGGLLCGIILTLLVRADIISKKIKINTALAGIILCAVLGYACYKNAYIAKTEMYLASDLNILEKYQSFGLNDYAMSKAEKLDTIYADGGYLVTKLKGE